MLRHVIKMAIVGTLVLTVALLAAIGPRPFQAVLPAAAVVLVEGLVGPNGLIGQGGHLAADAVPADFLVEGPGGLVATGPVAAGAGNVPVFIADVLVGHSTEVSGAIPAAITTIRPILGCVPTPPQSGSLVGHARAGTSDLPLALISYNDGDLALGVRDFVERYRSRGIAVPAPGDAHAFQAHDIAVTETAAPVYLVLESGGGNRIWNIHLAEGARIERVVLLGGAQSGVANLDPVIPVEVILAGGLADCGVAPADAPADGFAEVAAEVATEVSAAHDRWFRDSFGVSPGQGRIGFARGMVSVIGPLPGPATPRAIYAPIAGAEIRTTKDRHFEIRGQVPAGQDYAARVIAIATGFAFGDLANLRQGVGF